MLRAPISGWSSACMWNNPNFPWRQSATLCRGSNARVLEMRLSAVMTIGNGQGEFAAKAVVSWTLFTPQSSVKANWQDQLVAIDGWSGQVFMSGG